MWERFARRDIWIREAWAAEWTADYADFSDQKPSYLASGRSEHSAVPRVFEPSISGNALLHIINLDQTESDAAVLSCKDGGESTGRQRSEDSGFEGILRRESVRG